MIKNVLIIIILLVFSSVQAEFVITNSAKLKNIYEKKLLFSDELTRNYSNETISLDLLNKIQDELLEIDIDIYTKLIFADRDVVFLYSKPSFDSEKVGYVTLPDFVRVLKVQDDFVCIEVSAEKAAWLSGLHVDSEAFRKKLTEKKSKYFSALLARQVVSDNSQALFSPVSYNGTELGLAAVSENEEIVTAANEIFVKNIKKLDLAEIAGQVELIYDETAISFSLSSPLIAKQVTIVFDGERIPLEQNLGVWIGKFISPRSLVGNKTLKVFLVDPSDKLISVLRVIVL